MKTNFIGSPKHDIFVLHFNIVTFKLVLNSIEVKERQKIQTYKVSTKFRRETNPPKYHRQVAAPGPIFSVAGHRTCHDLA